MRRPGPAPAGIDAAPRQARRSLKAAMRAGRRPALSARAVVDRWRSAAMLRCPARGPGPGTRGRGRQRATTPRATLPVVSRGGRGRGPGAAGRRQTPRAGSARRGCRRSGSRRPADGAPGRAATTRRRPAARARAHAARAGRPSPDAETLATRHRPPRRRHVPRCPSLPPGASHPRVARPADEGGRRRRRLDGSGRSGPAPAWWLRRDAAAPRGVPGGARLLPAAVRIPPATAGATRLGPIPASARRDRPSRPSAAFSARP